MAGELVSFGVQKLWDLLTHKYEQIHGVNDQVTELKRDLNLLSSFIEDADKKRTRAVVRNSLEEIKEIIFDAEDIIETFLLKEEPGMTSGVHNHFRRLALYIPDRKEIAVDIEGISKRISKVIGDMQSFGVQQIIADSSIPPLYDRQREMRETFSTDQEKDLVGLEANIQTLVEIMVEENSVEVVSITGMGGVGKTTLARQVFNHKKVKDKFDGLAWVCLSQEFSRISVWQTILRNLSPTEDEKKIMKMTESTLQGELFQLLETSKSLIVLDDIWKEEDWDRIKPIFPPKKDWKVLLTSRNESVAACGDTTYINFKPDCLTFQNSWTLFQRVAFPRKDVSGT
ncbi:PREDICTED: probable disease resistance protein At1g58390 [Camelina sativa]|uniref:Probable disease resistance protein At1g58390 n=1 Tax=Camelina sativa TaxID=90675 RepID=A0ABM1RR84_CAMSA|nr:PREDICTED: probable disease resistance protein At1g58390 [Camelina sativa]